MTPATQKLSLKKGFINDTTQRTFGAIVAQNAANKADLKNLKRGNVPTEFQSWQD